MPRDMQYGYYLMAFLDVLGQRETLRELRQLPTDQRALDETIRVLKQTAGFVLAFRQCFKQLFERAYDPQGFLDSSPEVAQVMRHNPIELRGLSDSLIITIPICDEYDHSISAQGVYSLLVATCGVLAIALAERHPFRGGIDVGPGLRLTEEEVYGSVLERAYELESCHAKYPRVLIGTELWRYLSEVEERPFSTQFGNIAAESVRTCKELVMRDGEGNYMLDFLGDRIRSVLGDNHIGVVQDAYEFVVEKRKSLVIAGDAKLASRYDQLKDYFDSRLHLWGLQLERNDSTKEG